MRQQTALSRFVLSTMLVVLSLFAKAQIPTYEMYITNQSQVSSKIYQFDVYLLRTGSTPLEMAAMQFGLGYDTSILNGGTITFSFVSGSSQLVAAQVPQSFNVGTTFNTVGGVVYRYLNQAARTGPGAGSGTVISATKTSCSSPGTRIGTYRVTNTVDFKQASTAKHIFNVTAGSGRSATAVTCYVAGSNTTATGTLINYNSENTCDQNLSLNGCAITAGVSTTAVACFGQSTGTATVSLSGLGTSSTGTYSVDGGSAIAYSTNPFTVTGLSAGSHSIAITSGTCSASTGNFTIEGPAGPAVSTTDVTACNSYTWNGVTYTASGTYTANLTSGAGCDSTATLNLTINNSNSSTTNVSVCAATLPYVWNGNSYTASGSYSVTLTNASNCDSVATLNLTVNNSSSTNVNFAVCNTQLPFEWNGQSITGAGTYTATLTNASGCDSVVTATVIISGGLPVMTATAALTQTLVSNQCGNRVYRYSIASITNATGYEWVLPTSVGGVSGVTVDSGDATTSRTILVRYASNAASLTTDSIRVRAFSGCGNSAFRAARLINNLLTVPVAPTAITITPIQINVCGARIYRYAAPALTGATSGATGATAAATGYEWDFVGTLGANATIDSGDVNSRVIVVSFTSNVAAGLDSVRVRFTSDCGNSLRRAAKLTNVAINPPAAPAAITITPIQTNVCGARIYRYAAPALPGAVSAATGVTGAATGYEWDFVGTLGSTATIDSGDLNSSVIVVSYTSNAAAGLDSVRVRFTSDCGNSLRRAARLTNVAINPPAAPAAITITPIQTNVCAARIYRYAVPTLPGAISGATGVSAAATGYVWSFAGTLGANATIDSGDVNSRVIVVSFTSNAAAGLDSVRALYTSDCGNSLRRAAKLSNTALNPPGAPTAITITAVQPSVCGNKIYRYSAPALPTASATGPAANGYLWSFTGTLGANAVIDSGTTTGRTILVSFTSNAARVAGDSVRVLYTTNGCGNSPTKGAALTNVATALPAAPTGVTITPLQTNVCGARRYRYSAPALSAASGTVAAATGYEWDFVGSMIEFGTIDSGSLTSRAFIVTYTSNEAATTADSVGVRYTSSCGISARRAARLSNTKLNPPAAPSAITIQSIQTNVCGARRYRYSVPTLPVASTTNGAASGYLFDFVGPLSASMTVDSGSLTSRVFTVTFTSNAAAGLDSVRFRYTSACGNGAIARAKLSNALLAAPAVPASIGITQLSDVCGARRYRYSAPNLPTATATAGPADGWLWTMPTGAVGSTGTLDSGTLTSQRLVIVYTSNAAATTDSIRVRFTSGCGNSVIKAQKLSNTLKTGCPLITRPTAKVSTPAPSASLDVQVYPNPTTSQFQVNVKTTGTEEMMVRILDVQGRMIKSLKQVPNQTWIIGSDLKPGAYFLEVRQGKQVKTTRLVKF